MRLLPLLCLQLGDSVDVGRCGQSDQSGKRAPTLVILEMMTKPRRMGNLRLARLARYLVGTQKLVLRFDHQEYGDTARNVFHARRAGIPVRTSRGFVGCIRSSASIEFRRSRALGTRNIHKARVRGNGTNHQHRRRNGLDGCDRDVFPNGRWKDQTHSSSLVMDPRRHS